MDDSEKLTRYSQQLIIAISGHPEETVWRNQATASAYWQQVRAATEWCSGYAGAIITRLQAQANNQELNVQDITKCRTLSQLKTKLGI